ncbi:MAG: hypothetical protein RL701_5700 [Pseudomonadota bacterium]
MSGCKIRQRLARTRPVRIYESWGSKWTRYGVDAHAPAQPTGSPRERARQQTFRLCYLL